jgi:UDP:flavonoid glycosyltransferase YjiC (YdhE family)
MRAARVLHAWELGAGMGHVKAISPLLRALTDHGATVVPVLKDIAQASMLPGGTAQAVPKRMQLPSSGMLAPHAQILQHHGGFLDASNLLATVRNWLGIFEAAAPDLITCDFAPVAMLAARIAGIASVAVDSGFFSPPSDRPLPVSTQSDFEGESAMLMIETEVLLTANSVLARYSHPALDNCSRLFQASRSVFAHHAALDVFQRADRSAFVGPFFDHPVPLPTARAARVQPGGHRIFAYLNGQFPGTLAALKGMLDCHCSVTAFVASGIDIAARLGHPARLRILDRPADPATVLPACDLVVCHAGVGTINQALAHGKPLVLLPMFWEQALNAHRIEALDMGRTADLVGPRCIQDVLPNALAALPRMTGACLQFAATHAAGDAGTVARSLIESALEERKRRNPTSAQAPGSARVLAFKDLDVVFVSYDEPNADKHFEILRQSVPRAQRVHGVKGFHEAHCAAALCAGTSRFITVDADTQLWPEFFDTVVTVPAHLANSTWCWASEQAVNGLRYGNGGVKIWCKDMLSTLVSHERATGVLAYDFCHHAGYSQFDRCFSRTYPNSTPKQAFRSGLRESVKLGRGMDGVAIPPPLIVKAIKSVRARRLLIWMTVGADALNGLWTMLGARMGFLLNAEPGFDATCVSDFSWFDDYWEAYSSLEVAGADALRDEVMTLGRLIRDRHEFTLLQEWDARQSLKFKARLAHDRPAFGVFDQIETSL